MGKDAKTKKIESKQILIRDFDELQQQRLLSLERKFGPLQLLRFFSEQVLREQEIFWMRFGAFAAVHAGSLVLVTSDVLGTRKPAAAIVGVALGLSWMYVQWISLKYADRPKDQYHWYRKQLGILILWPYEREKHIGRCMILQSLRGGSRKYRCSRQQMWASLFGVLGNCSRGSLTWSAVPRPTLWAICLNGAAGVMSRCSAAAHLRVR